LSSIDEAPASGDKGEITAWRTLTADERLACRTFVEVSCLIHDVGNPPFGHFGEKAIQAWFRRQHLNLGNARGDVLRRDFEQFDGNKQGFRILTRLQRNFGDEFGLNLSYAQLAATIKYPVERGTKGSVFASEEEIKTEIWNELKLNPGERHPLSLIMEAADDIAYCVSDIEDANAKGLIPDVDLATVLGDATDQDPNRSRRFTRGRTNVTVRLVTEAAAQFVSRLAGAADGGFDTLQSLLKDNGRLESIRSVAIARIYSSRVVMANELIGFKVITGMLDTLRPLLEMEPVEFESFVSSFRCGEALPTVASKLTEQPGLLSLFPVDLLETYVDAVKKDAFPELFHRAHLLMDFVAGMTDDVAVRAYRIMTGQTAHAFDR
jgi:dGTPase